LCRRITSFGTRFRYNEATGEVDSIIRAAAGWGKISVLEELRANLGISHDHIIYWVTAAPICR